MKALLACLLLTGCATVPPEVIYKNVEVPVKVSCITTLPDRPLRFTPCPATVTNSTCIKLAAKDIETLAAAVDSAYLLLEACK